MNGKNIWFAVLCSTLLGTAFGDAVVGKLAPNFKLTDTTGKLHELSSLKGKIVVLEWTNAECPFVKKHYDSKNMQTLQKNATGKNVVWFSINSSAPGKQGNYDAKKWSEIIKSKGMNATAVLLDPDGSVGKLYGARTTPHMFVIDANGTLAYAGAIDDRPSADPRDIKKAKNYVDAALGALFEKKPVAVSTSEPYGCSVKY